MFLILASGMATLVVAPEIVHSADIVHADQAYAASYRALALQDRAALIDEMDGARALTTAGGVTGG